MHIVYILDTEFYPEGCVYALNGMPPAWYVGPSDDPSNSPSECVWMVPGTFDLETGEPLYAYGTEVEH